MPIAELYDGLPGGDLVAARSRLRAAGVPVPLGCEDADAPLALYRALGKDFGDDAHGRYLALLRRLESFARAAEHAARS